MENRYFSATEGKDGMFYLRVISPSKGILGNIVEKIGFLKFETQEEADAALDTLDAGGVQIKFGAVNNGIYLLEVSELETVTH